MTQTQRPPTLIPSVIAPAIQTGISSSHNFSERLWRRFATLSGRFRTLIIVIVVVTTLTAITISLSSSRAASNLNTIGKESIPGISAAQRIVPLLEDIDARAADYLSSTDPTPQPCASKLTGQLLGSLSAHDCADKLLDADQQELNHQLFLAGQNATYPGSSTALQQTLAGLQLYIGDITLMRHAYQQAASHTNPGDPFMQQAYQAARAAQSVLRQQLAGASHEVSLPACTLNGQSLSPQSWPYAGIETNMLCLSALGKPRLDSAYNDNVSFFGISLGLVFGLSIYCCIFLLWATWSMLTTTRKLFHPALTLAFLLALISTGVVLADFDAIYGHNGLFSVIASDYNNVYAAGTLEQQVSQVQADQARWLDSLTFQDAQAAAQWRQQTQLSTQHVSAALPALITQAQTSSASPLLSRLQQDWQRYLARVEAVDRQVGANGQTGLAQARNLHVNAASADFQSVLGDIQQFINTSTNDYSGLLSEASSRLSALTTWLAIAFPLFGVMGAWGISRRLPDF